MNYITIDIGGTEIKSGVINDNFEFLEKKSIPTKSDLSASYIVDQCFDLIDKYLIKYDIEGVCISTAGMVDANKGEIYFASKLIPNYMGTNFKELIKAHYNLNCEVENDVNCAGLAEALLGNGKDDNIVFCTTIGTGIGGSIIINKEIFHGSCFSAGEIGYMQVMGEEFQMIGSSKALVNKVCEMKNISNKNLNGKKIFELAKNGDQDCLLAIDEMCEIIGYGLANICYLLNPDVIVIGGGITNQEEYLLEKIDKYLQKYLIPHLYQKTKIKIAKFKNDAGMIGAYLNYKNKVN